jgi:hypothetical protein
MKVTLEIADFKGDSNIRPYDNSLLVAGFIGSKRTEIDA